MRLVTSCPACDTRFHVKPEQLAAHGGDLRCGQCRHLFNAGSRLYEVLEPQTLAPLPPAPASEEPIPDQITAEAEEASHALPHETNFTSGEADSGTAESPGPEDILPTEELITAPEPESADTVEIDRGESVDTETEPLSAGVFSEQYADEQAAEIPEADEQPVAASFLAPDKPVRQRRFPLWLTVPLSLLLLLALLAQSIYFFRTQLSGYWPASRPALESACLWLGCTVPLPRNAELLALDDSDLQEDFEHPEVIQLSTKLINNASYTQAYPMLELTLTDDDDQPKLRRIFKPEEYLPSGMDIQAGLAANGEIQVNLAFSTSGEAVSGYRVFVTY
ncbi:zinc-ribbon domain-containing protein [Methylobacillus flagellatus]|uniref:zinc-ribbon and DUF3426 domain-containing protein n=1 Tax=Methylobacillus flagellatus TaxID=405 RepID=UPI00285394D4|nr:DUF3426 domain-containing protein [Methylobacillus flagellatus]MDR5172151.1 zinc-ribbon domain-containing protein [Methylobacillus flagellatus]